MWASGQMKRRYPTKVLSADRLRKGGWACIRIRHLLNVLRSVLPFLFFTAIAGAEIPRDLIGTYCVNCHDAEEKKGGLDLEALEWKPGDRANQALWVKVFDFIDKGEMPPKNRKQRPDAAEMEEFLGALGKELTAADVKREAESGRTVLRRLNRVEYERTLHELLGIRTPLTVMLPNDTPMHGFDTVAEGLRLSTLQMEKYLEAADKAIDDAIRLGPAPEVVKDRFDMVENQEVRWHLEKPESKGDGAGGAGPHRHLLRKLPDGVVFFNTGYPSAQIKPPKEKPRSRPEGIYKVRISGYAYQSPGVSVPMRVYSNNYKDKQLLGWFEMEPDKPQVVEFTTFIRGGDFIQIEPSNTGQDKEGKNVYNTPVKDFAGSGLALQWVEVEGPMLETWPPKGVATLFGDIPVVELDEEAKKKNKNVAYEIRPQDPKADSKRALEHFAGKAFRRPLEAGEVDRYVGLTHAALDEGQPFMEAMRIGFRAILVSPQFLFFREDHGKLDDHALASRLSYFLWSRPPDGELLKLAAEKKLSQPEVLRGQVERLLKDGNSAAFVEDFTGQWLDLRNIDATTPDAKLYPEADELLRLSMPEETKAYFAEMLQADLPVTTVVDSDFVMVNGRLAEHYQIPGVSGQEIRKVKLPPDSPRGGFLTQASVLKITANGTTTSPVIRGAWVMKRILGQPPSPPPPGVGSIEPDTRGATTVREQLALHRNSESCAACHAKIDPPGFALESFDVIGGHREQYRSQGEGGKLIELSNTREKRKYVKYGQQVDASGDFDGKAFVDIREFKKLILEKPDQVMTAMAGKLVTYSTGAGITFADRTAVAGISRKTKEQGGGLRTLVHQVVASPLFQSK